ncbi:DUF4349 domain-containing protein [Tessaracoccus antarcticus]|nr:DUF4349 domain-containing protein [Tessaracoccus antarcticus]
MITRLTSFMACVAVLLTTALLGSCSASSGSNMPAVGEQLPARDGGGMGLPQENGEDAVGDEGRLIIRTKTLRLEVEKTPTAVDQIRELTRTHSGTVSDLQVATDSQEWVHRYNENGVPEGDGAALRGWVTVRVPTKDYEDFIAAVAELGVVKFQSEAASDVTQEHLDLAARLKNLRAQEVRLREFFDAAKNVEDMLAVEKELGRVRGEIESLDAQVTYLERQAAMATVTVELTEPLAVVRPGGESWGFVGAITTGIRGAAALMTGLLTFLIASSPVWVVGGVLFLVIRALMRRRRARAGRMSPATASTVTEAVATPEE